MALISTWSRRKREAAKAASGVADVYRYDKPSSKLREQIRQVLVERIDHIQNIISDDICDGIVSIMRKEIGKARLVDSYTQSSYEEIQLFILRNQDIDEFLSFIEIASRLIGWYADRRIGSEYYDGYQEELNSWMLEDGFGYQLDGRNIIQINNQYLHAEVIVPALSILADSEFAGANSEFRQAHAEYRAGEYEDCIHDCCNALESTLKVIFTKKGWRYQTNDAAKKLLEVAFSNSLIPDYMQSQFTGLRAMLESGVPTTRNKNAGHGSGSNPRNIPKYIASFQLNQTAAAILLIAEAAK